MLRKKLHTSQHMVMPRDGVTIGFDGRVNTNGCAWGRMTLFNSSSETMEIVVRETGKTLTFKVVRRKARPAIMP